MSGLWTLSSGKSKKGTRETTKEAHICADDAKSKDGAGMGANPLDGVGSNFKYVRHRVEAPMKNLRS